MGRLVKDQNARKWRRERDSNSRHHEGATVFETVAFDHSAIPPPVYTKHLIVVSSASLPHSFLEVNPIIGRDDGPWRVSILRS